MKDLARRWLREPLLHFVVVGAALFALHARMTVHSDDSAAAGEIVVTQGRIRNLVETFARQWSRPPSEDEVAGLVRDFVREEVLAREALALGLDRDDTIVRRRLAQKMEFVSDDIATVTVASDDELRGFLAAHPERFRTEARFTFSQILLDGAKRGDTLDADAAALLAWLNAPGAGSAVAGLGDGRVLEAHFTDVPRRDVEAQLGAGFAARLETLPLERFVWPVESGYGAHLVRVDARTPGRLPAFDEVRDAVARDWTAAKRREIRQAQLEALLGRYRVIVEPDAAPEPDHVAEARR